MTYYNPRREMPLSGVSGIQVFHPCHPKQPPYSSHSSFNHLEPCLPPLSHLQPKYPPQWTLTIKCNSTFKIEERKTYADRLSILWSNASIMQQSVKYLHVAMKTLPRRRCVT